MDDKYYQLIYNFNLYPLDFIDTFGKSGTHWKTESNRQRELSLRHDMACVLLCNQQEISLEALVEGARKRKLAFADPIASKKKKTQYEASTSSSSSSGSSKLAEETQTVSENYRFFVLEGLPNAASFQHKYAAEWNCPKPTKMWDIVDVQLKKFIEVKVTINARRVLDEYLLQSAEMQGFSSLCLIDARSGSIQWRDHPGNLNGETKVKHFIVSRYTIMCSLKIDDSDLQEESDLEKSIFCSDYFNKLVDEWKDTWLKASETPVVDFESISVDDPKTIRKADLQELSRLTEKERVDPIRWKGKIAPEGFVHNLKGEWYTDAEMNSYFIELIKSELNGENSVYRINLKSEDTNPQTSVIDEVIRLWEESEKNPFSVSTRENLKRSFPLISETLGIGAKRRRHNDGEKMCFQPEYKENPPLRYHTWMDEVVRRMNFQALQGMHVYPQILESENEPDHPVAKMSREGFNLMANELLSSNTAIFSSKVTNLYNRLGGSYLVWDPTQKKGNQSSIAMMPIYATAQDDNTKNTLRLLSGICIRGPAHAKISTSRISMIVVELYTKEESTPPMIAHLAHAVVFETRNFFIVMRATSIIKEDPSYLAFIANALFIPANILGDLTLQSPRTISVSDIRGLINQVASNHSKWLLERYTEGVLMAAIGNSRDEGYFACLRKLFMILLSMRRNEPCASWGFPEFVKNTNEMLVDNPFSMYFHLNLMDVIDAL